jgi:phospholipase/carboxylesterase/glyoxalase family protein
MLKLGFVHRFVPPVRKGQPTLLLLHGTGGNENDMLPVGRELDPKAGMLTPRGKVMENGMPRFFRRFAEGVFDLEDLVYRSQELAEFLRAASARYGFDALNVVAVGYSNGANIATSLALLHPDVLAGAILFRPMLPLVPKQLPDLTNLKLFISAGNLDPIVSREETEKLVSFLRKWEPMSS